MERIKAESVFIFVFVLLVWSSLPHFSCGIFEDLEGKHIPLKAGGRQLLQNQLPCPVEYQFYNFTPILTACPHVDKNVVDVNYPRKSCCEAFARVVCLNLTAFNNVKDYNCNDIFFSYLNLAGNYTVAFFANLCTDVNSPEGLACPSTPAAPPPSFSAAKDPSLSVLWVFIAIAVFEILAVW